MGCKPTPSTVITALINMPNKQNNDNECMDGNKCIILSHCFHMILKKM